MKLLFVGVLTVFLTLPAFGSDAPALPWSRYDAIIGAIRVGPACNDQADILLLSDEWKVLSSGDRDVFVHFTQGQPDYVFLTQGNAQEGTITVRRTLAITDAQRLYPDPCAYFTEVLT